MVNEDIWKKEFLGIIVFNMGKMMIMVSINSINCLFVMLFNN